MAPSFLCIAYPILSLESVIIWKKFFLMKGITQWHAKGEAKGQWPWMSKWGGGGHAIREGKKILILKFISEANLFHVSSIFANSK